MSLVRPPDDDSSTDAPPSEAVAPSFPEGGGQPVAAGSINLAEARRFLERALMHMSFRKDAVLVEELAQEALVNFHRYVSTGGVARNLEALLNTFAKRTFINHQRRERVRRNAFAELSAGPPQAAAANPVPGDEGDALGMIEFVTIEHFTSTSAPCLVLARHYFESYDWQVVAERLGLKPAAVRKRWSRCVEALRECARVEGSALWALGPKHEGH